MSDHPGPSRRLCWTLVGVGALLLAVGAMLVPWSWVPGGSVLPVRAADAFPADDLRRAETYSSLRRHLGWIALAVSLAVGLALGLTPLGARAGRRLKGPWWVRLGVLVLLVLLVGELATLPLDLLARGHALDYGITEQSLAGWARDHAVSFGVSWVFATGTVMLVVGPARRWPRRWPVFTAAAGALLTVAGSWAYPVVVEPLFNTITPLAQGPLRTEILEIARAEKVPIDDVLVADASRRTTTLNAYVSGFGSTRRVVLYDNLVEGTPRRETLVVVAHELGHTKNRDVVLGTLLAAAGVVLGSGLLGLLLSRRWLLRRAGVSSPGHPEVVALVLVLATLGALLASPVENTISRAIEARADRVSIEATGDCSGFERLQVQLATRSLADPTPPALSQFWFGSHPTAVQRLGLARALCR